jgi:transcriptional regulator with XRE-family HTH domain
MPTRSPFRPFAPGELLKIRQRLGLSQTQFAAKVGLQANYLACAERGERTIRLRLTRGAWRIDCASLVALGETVDPVRVRPSVVMRGSEPDTSALAALLDPRRSVVTLPGDELVLRYRLPDTPAEQEIFLESRGYYLEWMRPEWLAEENPLRAAALFYDPQGTLRSLAPAYKRIEPDMERAFWSSRYAAH